MTTTTVTIQHKNTGEIKTIDCGVEGQDYTFVSECVENVSRQYPDYNFIMRESVSDHQINFLRPLTYGF